MKTLLLIVLSTILFWGCLPPENVNPETGASLSFNHGLPTTVTEFEYKGHWFMERTNGGLIHAPYCECKINNHE